MYKVFVNNKPLFLTSEIKSVEKAVFPVLFLSVETLKLSLEVLENTDNVQKMAIVHSNSEYLWKVFLKQFDLLKAAGGVVENERGEILFIHRNGMWDLPKGKLNKNEKAKYGAIREVEEECNISDLTIIKQLSPTYHTYRLKGKKILKKTSWFLMKAHSNQNLKPQIEEGITECKWFPKSHLDTPLGKTYESIKEVLDDYLRK